MLARPPRPRLFGGGDALGARQIGEPVHGRGGYYTIDAKTAKKVADAIAPRVLVPMHYRFGAHGYPEIGTLDEFLALYEAKKIHKLDGNSFELTKNAPAGVIVPRFAE